MGPTSQVKQGKDLRQRRPPLVPLLVPASGKPGVLQSIIDKAASAARKIGERGTVAVSAYAVKENNPLTTAVNGLRKVERRRVELPTSALRKRRSHCRKNGSKVRDGRGLSRENGVLQTATNHNKV